jgi:hypothetical protein
VYTRVTPWLDSLIDPLVPPSKVGASLTPDDGDMGDACTSGKSCASGICVSPQAGGYCSRACGTGSRCPNGYRCAKSADHPVCAKKS